jgi:hypothetical protein
MRNIPPGNYRLTVRQNPSGPRNPDRSPDEPGEFATVPLAVTGDLENVLVITTPGVTISGQIVFEQGPPLKANQTSSQPVRVYATIGDPADNAGMGQGPSPAVAGPDMTFTIKGLIGEYLLRANASNAPIQYLKSVSLNGNDITDTPREFKQGDRVIITLSSRSSTLEGSVTDDQGKPVTDAGLILFSEDKGSWRSNSIRTHRQTVDPTGHYRIMGLVPGRYFLTAVPRDRLSFGTVDAGFFEQLSKEATSLVVGEDEQRQVDLKVVAAPGGGN